MNLGFLMEKREYSQQRDKFGFECPECGSSEVRTRNETQRFVYGDTPSRVELSAIVPVRSCESCGFEFTDAEAEDVRHKAICRYLGVLTPEEIIAIRKAHDMSRVHFSEISGIGSASLARWESGNLIQNSSSDALLYLLRFEDNVARLKNRRSTPQHTISIVSESTPSATLNEVPPLAVSSHRGTALPRFRALTNIRGCQRLAAGWKLRRGSSRL